MVFAPQRLPNTASSTLSIGRERTVFWGICPCSRHGAKKQWRRRSSPRAHRLARLVVIMRSCAMAHSFPPRGIAPLLTLQRSISPGRSSLYSYFSPNACPASWRKKLAAGPPEASPTLQPLRRRPITGPRLAPAYANMSTYSTAVRLGTAAPEAMRRRFTRHHMPPPTSTARWERGTARRTSVLCRSLRLRDLRRELHEGRNGVAQWPSANACILFGTGGEIATQR